MTTANILCPKTMMQKSWQGFELYIRRQGSGQTSKRFNADIHGLIVILFRFLQKDFPENITSKPCIIMGHTTVVQKGSEHRLCQKTKGKRMAFRTGIQRLFNMLFNRKLTR